MKWTSGALKLIRIFSSGVSCPKWNKDSIEKTMFYSHCEDVARKKNKKKIDEEVVRDYILKIHNPITTRVGLIGKEDIKAIENCMVRPRKTDDGWVCVHGTVAVMPISQSEAEFLERKNKKLLKSL